MAETNQTEDQTPAAEAQQDVAQTSDTKAEAAAKASDELSEDDLEAVAGGLVFPKGKLPTIDKPR